MTRHDLIISTIRTAVPAAVGKLLANIIATFPVVADAIASIDRILTEAAPEYGFTARGLLDAAAIGVVVGAYYAAVRTLGDRFPAVERWLLGSAQKPTYQIKEK